MDAEVDASAEVDAGSFDTGFVNDWDVGPKPDATAEDTGSPPVARRLFPLAVGAEWTLQVTLLPDLQVTSKTQRVLRTEPRPVGDVFILETIKGSGKRTVSEQFDDGSSIIRFEETVYQDDDSVDTREVYIPSKLRVPNTLPLGTILRQSYTEEQYDGTGQLTGMINKTEEWLMTGPETISVPAGTFETYRVARRNVMTLQEKTYWFADGIGKIREQSQGQLEELTSYVQP